MISMRMTAKACTRDLRIDLRLVATRGGRRSTLHEAQFPAGHRAKVGAERRESAEIQATAAACVPAALYGSHQVFLFSRVVRDAHNLLAGLP